MIKIGQPFLIEKDNMARVISELTIDGETCQLWAEVDKKYAQYICYEHSDAFVVAILHYAIMNNHDIICEAPMNEDLYYQISTYTIDALTKWSPNMHKIMLKSEIDSQRLPCAGKVGTGISCGIDSFHALALHADIKMNRHRITHLLFNNTGSHGEGVAAEKLYNERRNRIESFCSQYGFDLIELNSNIKSVFKQNHLLSHTYTSMFSVFCLQKLFSVYYYASGHTINDFTIKDTDINDPAFYDIFLLQSFSTENLKLYSEGVNLTRLEKTKEVAKYEPSYNYLNVCVKTSENCGKCEKCRRTLLALDAIGKIDSYTSVFDVDYYKNNKIEYLIFLEVQKKLNNIFYIEMYPYFKRNITPLIKIRAIPIILSAYTRRLFNLIKKHLPNNVLYVLYRIKR